MELLSDHLKVTRDHLKLRKSVGLFMMPGRLSKLIQRFNTLIAMAENQEEELRLALTQRDLDELPNATILRFPRRLVIVTSPRNGGDAA